MRRNLLIITALVLAVAAIYGQTLSHDLVWIDDRPYITNNPVVMRGLSWEGVGWAFTTLSNANWHPLTWLSHMLDVTLWGDWAGGHHLTNAVLHALNSVLVFLVVRQLTAGRPSSVIGHRSSGNGSIRLPTPDHRSPSSPWPAAFVAALFAVHPMHVESVAWVAERKDVLCAFFFLLTLGAYARYARADRYRLSVIGNRSEGVEASPITVDRSRITSRSWYGLTLLCFIFALLSKPMAVTLPFVLLLLDYWPLRRLGGEESRSRKDEKSSKEADFGIEAESDAAPAFGGFDFSTSRLRLAEKLPFFALSAASCVVTSIAQRAAMAPIEQIGMAHRIANALVSYGAYLVNLFWPVGLCFDYPYRTAILLWQLIGAAALLGGGTIFCLRVRHRYPYVLVGWLWFLGMLVPVVGLVQVGDAAMADRYAYLPYLGIYLMVAWGFHNLSTTAVRRRWITVIAMAVLTVLTFLAHRQTAFWRNTITLFERTLEVAGPSETAFTALGAVLSEHGRMEEALARLEDALRIGPHVAETRSYLAMTLMKMGRYEAAAQQARGALDLKPEHVATYGALGEALFAMGRTNEAVAVYQAGLKLDPAAPFLHYDLGRVAEEGGRYDEAVSAYRQAMVHNPDSWLQRIVLAGALMKAGQLEAARAELHEATLAVPNTKTVRDLLIGAHLTLAAAMEERQMPEALTVIRAAMQIDPAALGPRRDYLLHLCRTKSSDARAAAQTLYQMLERVDFAEFQVVNDLAWIRATHPDEALRDVSEAIELAERAAKDSAYRDPTVLDTLGAAYASAGRFSAATTTTARAMHLAETRAEQAALAGSIRTRLTLYAKGEPFRDATLSQPERYDEHP